MIEPGKSPPHMENWTERLTTFAEYFLTMIYYPSSAWLRRSHLVEEENSYVAGLSANIRRMCVQVRTSDVLACVWKFIVWVIFKSGMTLTLYSLTYSVVAFSLADSNCHNYHIALQDCRDLWCGDRRHCLPYIAVSAFFIMYTCGGIFLFFNYFYCCEQFSEMMFRNSGNFSC